MRQSNQNKRHNRKKKLAGADAGILERGAGTGSKPRTERQRRERRRGVWGPPSENFVKLDAISYNLAYIFGIRMTSDIIQNWAIAEQKTVAATIRNPPILDKKRLICRVGLWDHRVTHTHMHTPPTLPKTPRISATIKSKFNFKNIFYTLYTM